MTILLDIADPGVIIRAGSDSVSDDYIIHIGGLVQYLEVGGVWILLTLLRCVFQRI